LDDPSVFKDAKILDIQVITGETKEIEDEFVVHKLTFYKFITDKGFCPLSFRNESNGYYNGYLQLHSIISREYFYAEDYDNLFKDEE